MNQVHLPRQRRIKMFLNEYYFGQKRSIQFIRLVMGPVLPFVGLGLYHYARNRFGIAYAGFCIFYGIYYLLKPVLEITSYWQNFRTLNFDLELTSDTIKIREGKDHLTIDLSWFKNIFKRKSYFVLVTDTHLKIYLPQECLSVQEIKVLESKVHKKVA